jgi:hypothetical protein
MLYPITTSGSTLRKNFCHAISIADSSSKEATVVPDIGEQVPRVNMLRIKGVIWPKVFRQTGTSQIWDDEITTVI